jgi:hypothetical protein
MTDSRIVDHGLGSFPDDIQFLGDIGGPHRDRTDDLFHAIADARWGDI